MAHYYEWFRALHIISVLAWAAGLMMVPRFFAYQTEAIRGGDVDLLMQKAASRLMKIILAPAMVAAWLFGLATFFARFGGALPPTWLAEKLGLALLLSAFHGFLAASRKKLAQGERPHSGRFWRMLNEVPFVVMTVIILLAVLEPF